jgi:hypothetical protein
MTGITRVANNLDVKRGYSRITDEVEAVKDLYDQINQPGASAVITFVSAKYDLNVLGKELKSRFSVPVIGCTTAGEITPEGYQEHSIAGVSLSSDRLWVRSYEISPLDNLKTSEISEIGESVRTMINGARENDPESRAFGFVLIDGMSIMEEQVICHLHGALGNIPIIGGSAGDNLAFDKTYIYSSGGYKSNTASFTVFVTSLPFSTFKTQHFIPTDKKIVITEADPSKRVIKEIDGEPAAQRYAAMVGTTVDKLDPTVYSKFPVMLKIGGDYYVRSIQKANEDGSLSFYCAIEEGLVLTMAHGKDLIRNLEETLENELARIPNPKLVLGCECILRRLEVQDKGLVGDMNRLIKRYGIVGFHSYGEQFNSVHVNQTFTGFILGE